MMVVRLRLLGAAVLALCAALSVARPAHAEGVTPDVATPEQQQRAQALYEEGVGHYQARRFEEAASAFSDSYLVVASPNSHLMWSRALREAGQLDRAYEELLASVAEAAALAARVPRYESTRAATQAELDRVSREVGVLRIQVVGAADASVFVDERSVPPSRLAAVAVMPGSHDVVARRTGGHRAWQAVEVRAGQRLDVKLDLSAPQPAATAREPAPAPRREAPPPPDTPAHEPASAGPLRTWVYVAGGVGAAGLLTFAVAGTLSRSTHSELQDTCPGNVCPAERQADIDHGKTQQAIANVGLVVGIAGVGTAVTLFMIDRPARPSTGAGRRARLALQAAPGGLSLGGRF
jgi:hypothetical protein